MYPLVPPPAGDIGALTWPRRLQRWLDNNPVTRLTRASTYIQLPTFNQGVSTWNGYSDIVASFNFEGVNNISLKDIVPPSNPNYVCCICYRVGSNVTRYLLWDAIGSLLPGTFTPYTNQAILKNFRLEIWNTSQGAVSEVNGLTMYTSKLAGMDYRYLQDGALVIADGESTNFFVNGSIQLPYELNIYNAGSANVNGVYYYTSTIDNHPAYSGGSNVIISHDEHVIYHGEDLGPGWTVVDTETGEDYLSYDQVISPDLIISWLLGPTGILPAPIINVLSQYTAYTLPLTFPVGSHSETN